MSKIEIFIVLINVGYFDTILIPDTNKVLKDPFDPGELMSWFGC